MFLKRDSFPVPAQEENVTVAANRLPRDTQASSNSLENENLEASAVRISVSELRRLQSSGAPILILMSDATGILKPANFRPRGAQDFTGSAGATDCRTADTPADMVDRLLRLTRRSDKRPCGAGATKGGWGRARALVGGWEAWQAAGLPVEAKAGL